MKTKLILTLIIFLGFVLAFANLASAKVEWTPLVEIPGMPSGAAPLGGYLVSLYNFLLAAVGIIAMVMIVYGGFRYMTSAGNPATMADAKDIVYSSIIGLALALLSWIIVNTINPELIFTTGPGMPSANLPSVSIGGNVPPSCAYGSLSRVEGPEPDECHCIGWSELPPPGRDCRAFKSDFDWCNTLNCERPITADDVGCGCGSTTVGASDVGKYCCAFTNSLYNPAVPPADPDSTCKAACTKVTSLLSCDSLCETIVCRTYPYCCVKADLRGGTSTDDVKYKKITVKRGKPVFFDVMGNTYTCLTGGKIVRIGVQITRPWLDFGIFQAQWSEEIVAGSPCNCGIALSTAMGPLPFDCKPSDSWCNSGVGRFTAPNDSLSPIPEGSYNPWLRVCVEDAAGNCITVDDKSVYLDVE